MPPFTHVIKGEKKPVEAFSEGIDEPYIEKGRSSEDVGKDISEVEANIIKRSGTFLRTYRSDPNNGDGETHFIVVDYPDIAPEES